MNGTENNYFNYNGKELDKSLGLEWLDFGARNYDASIGRWMNIDPAADVLESSSQYVYALNSPIVYLDKDGELPILINGKTSSDSERGSEKYWSAEVIETIKGSGIANPGGQMHYVDGNRGWNRYNRKSFPSKTLAHSASARVVGGKLAAKEDWKSILSKLERDPDTGKIVEKIQIYTHSRGGAFGVGYTEQLLKLIKENSDLFADASNVIDFVLNLAPHQSNSLDSPDGVDGYSIDRIWDMLSGDDMGGLTVAFKSNAETGKLGNSHKIKSFIKDLSAFTKSFVESKGDNSKLIDGFVDKMKKLGITVTVKE